MTALTAAATPRRPRSWRCPTRERDTLVVAVTSVGPDDISNPFFVRFYRRNRRSAVKRGENEHRRRAVEGLAGVVVELGAGDGANFPLYPETVTEVIAVEPEPRFRAQATEAARQAEVPIRVEPGTAENLPVEDASVDAVLASLVLCTVPDQAAALTEARRVLRPGGELRFYEHVHAESQPLRAVLEVLDRSHIWPTIGGGCHPARDTLSAIKAAGFTVERCEHFGFSPSPMIPKIPHILGVARRE
jgi:ubiquinone/menaquinone biosynthesis C-methylase UbiE